VASQIATNRLLYEIFKLKFNYTTIKLLSKVRTSVLGLKNNRSIKRLFWWLPKWNDVRTFRWVDLIQHPEVMIKQVRKLLFVVG